VRCGVFVKYRRNDTEWAASLLVDALRPTARIVVRGVPRQPLDRPRGGAITTTTVRTAPSARLLHYDHSPSSREARRTASGGGPDAEA
jgi:hypothetical protein